MYPNHGRYRKRLRVLKDEIRNEEFYYLDGQEVYLEDLIPEKDEDEDSD